MKKLLTPLLLILLVISVYLWLQSPQQEQPAAQSPQAQSIQTIDEHGSYTDKESVARYLFTYKRLPGNFITKQKARDEGWVAEQGNLWEVTDQMSIGGDRFMNREGLLPEKSGRKWYECDIDYKGGNRGAKRIVYSNDGLVYYTDDHYDSFTEIKESELP